MPFSLRDRYHSSNYDLTKANHAKAWDAKLLAYVPFSDGIRSQGCRAYPSFRTGLPYSLHKLLFCWRTLIMSNDLTSYTIAASLAIGAWPKAQACERRRSRFMSHRHMRNMLVCSGLKPCA